MSRARAVRIANVAVHGSGYSRPQAPAPDFAPHVTA